MNTVEKYNKLPPEYQNEIKALIEKRICGKSHIADITIEESELSSYDFKVTVCKYNTKKGWATIAYIRHDIFRGRKWRLTFNPQTRKGEVSTAGKTGTYNG